MENKNSALKIGTMPMEYRIFSVRGSRVMLDSDLAKLYQVTSRRLNEQVKRNIERFPEDFMFQLNNEELANLRSQFATSSSEYGGRRYLPYAFTEHGVAMLSAVLRSDRAVAMSVHIVRAFVKLREMAVAKGEFTKKLEELEREQMEQGELLAEVCDTVNGLINAPIKPVGPMGFKPKV